MRARVPLVREPCRATCPLRVASASPAAPSLFLRALSVVLPARVLGALRLPRSHRSHVPAFRGRLRVDAPARSCAGRGGAAAAAPLHPAPPPRASPAAARPLDSRDRPPYSLKVPPGASALVSGGPQPSLPRGFHAVVQASPRLVPRLRGPRSTRVSGSWDPRRGRPPQVRSGLGTQPRVFLEAPSLSPISRETRAPARGVRRGAAPVLGCAWACGVLHARCDCFVGLETGVFGVGAVEAPIPQLRVGQGCTRPGCLRTLVTGSPANQEPLVW